MERVRMFDPLLEEDPWVMKLKARVKEEGRVEGREEGRLEEALSTSRKFLVRIVSKCFPSLTSLAELRASQIEKPDLLADLTEAIVEASDEREACALREERSLR